MASGSVVAAGSPGYQWLGSSIVDCAPPPVPAKLRAAIEASKATPAEPSNVVHLSPMQALARQLARPTAGSSNAWAEQALNAEIGRVMAAGPGSRNHVLNRGPHLPAIQLRPSRMGMQGGIFSETGGQHLPFQRICRAFTDGCSNI